MSQRSGSSASFDHGSRLFGVLVVVGAAGARRETNGHGALVADRFLRLFDQLAQQPGAVLEGAAVLVGPLIRGQQELAQQEPVAGVDVDDVETGSLGTPGGLDVPAAELSNVRLVHLPGLDRIEDACGPAPGAEGRLARVEVRAGGASVPELDAREGAVGVNLVDHQGVGAHVLVVPDRCRRIRIVVARWVDGAVLRAHHAPPAFGLDLAHARQGLRPAIAHSRAVGDLVEAVLRGHRADANRLEEDVVTRFACHRYLRADSRAEVGRSIINSFRHARRRLLGRIRFGDRYRGQRTRGM